MLRKKDSGRKIKQTRSMVERRKKKKRVKEVERAGWWQISL
jgi:hypothetical protein